MPIYVYEPDASETQNDCCYFETLQSMSEAPLTKCPTCNHGIHRVIAGFAVTHKNQPVPKGAKLFSRSNDTPAGRAASNAMKHVCSLGCRH